MVSDLSGKERLLLINFKAYESSVGKAAVRLAAASEAALKESKKDVVVAIAVQPMDIRLFADIDIPVFAQHIDPIMPGARTGHILPDAVSEAGAVGTLINHSERQLPLDVIDATVKRAKEVDLLACVCASTPMMSAAVASTHPDYIAVEPPELIGGEVSVSKAKPEVIVDTINEVHEIDETVPVLCGAGVKDQADVRIAVKLGSRGILVASGVTKAKDPKAAVLDLLAGF
ncbi:Triosephosphate isomerase [uncultured archaeon]|nr:Triosephosphate isomerase [uncultured archaeon]